MTGIQHEMQREIWIVRVANMEFDIAEESEIKESSPQSSPSNFNCI